MNTTHSKPSSANLFQELLETIQSLTGLRTVIYDRQRFTARAGRHAIDSSFAGHRSDFCALIRSAEGGQEACTASDVVGATEDAGRRGEPFLHVCHAGLRELVIPVLYRGEQVATVFCGQAIVDGCPAESTAWLSKRAAQLGLDAQAAKRVRDALPRISEDKLVQIGRMLFLALNHLAETEGRTALERALALERSEAIRSAVIHVDHHFQEPLRVEDMARRVSLTPAYFSRLFHKVTGMTFVDYLTQRRIAEAKELLKSTTMRVIDVAFAVGYGDQSYFGRRFRQITGQTPTTFRRDNWIEPQDRRAARKAE